MGKKRLIGLVFAVAAVVLAVGLVPVGWNDATANPQAEGGKKMPGKAPAKTMSDVDAIQQVIERNLDVTNNPATANLTLDERVALGRQSHRPDSTYAAGNLPMYFATNSAPILRGAEAYIRASELEFEAYRKKGYKYEVQIEDMQIYQDGRLAVVLATPRGLITSPEGVLMGGAPARWTLALEKAKDGQWYIFHEHLSFYSDDGTTPDQKLQRLESAVAQIGQ